MRQLKIERKKQLQVNEDSRPASPCSHATRAERNAKIEMISEIQTMISFNSALCLLCCVHFILQIVIIVYEYFIWKNKKQWKWNHQQVCSFSVTYTHRAERKREREMFVSRRRIKKNHPRIHLTCLIILILNIII